jgi:hypothetical protein
VINNLINKRILYALLALGFSAFACEPMIAIGKYELLFLVLLIAVLLGPPLYRFARRVEDFLKREKKDKS